MYDAMNRAKQLYGMLQDKLSKDIFKTRLTCDLDPSMTNAINLLCLNQSIPQEEVEEAQNWKNTLDAIAGDGKKFVLYGTGGEGQNAALLFIHEGIDFYGFCRGRGNGPSAYPNGLFGKPVISPDYLIQHADEFYIAIFAHRGSYREIIAYLEKNSFPQDHVLHCFEHVGRNKQYFEFPSLYRKNTAFIDGGCLNGGDADFFAEWCGGEYSQIIAFEPDPKSYSACLQHFEKRGLKNVQLIQAGLSDKSGILEFSADGDGGSHILGCSTIKPVKPAKKIITIQTTSVDNFECDKGQNVGFIKLDIEGAELDALHGAEQTILRNKPFLAVCVYHRAGDVLAIMDYVHQLVPEYKFWLRHYGPLNFETVLHASVDKL